jgi:hypothetical protein
VIVNLLRTYVDLRPEYALRLVYLVYGDLGSHPLKTQLQITAKTAQRQQWLALRESEQLKPGLPFHPGAGIPKP